MSEEREGYRIKICNRGRGLSFHDWIDAFLRMNIAELRKTNILGNWKEDLEENESYWFDYFATTYGLDTDQDYPVFSPPPDIVRSARGLGSWRNAEIVTITPTIETGMRPPNHGSDYWVSLPVYIRAFPFSSSAKSLLSFRRLLSSCPEISNTNTYVTAYKKLWTPDTIVSDNLFFDEMDFILSHRKTKTIVVLNNENLTKKILDAYEAEQVSIYNLAAPRFFTSWHGHGYRDYYARFCRLVCGGNDRRGK